MASKARFLWQLCFIGGLIGCGQSVLERQLFQSPRGPRINLFNKEAQSVGRVWRPDLAILPFSEFHGNEITIRHVRNCRYRTEEDYDVRHYDLRFLLTDVVSVDFIVVPFKETTLLAHTMFSFGLRTGEQFCISVEARLDQGESYSAIGGLRKKYELIYVIADERDVIPLRTNTRDVEVFLYRGNANSEQAQNLLVDMLARSNKLQREPEFYDLINNNCTTNLVSHVNQLRPGRVPFDWRVVLPGHSDRLAYELGLIQSAGSFEQTKKMANITMLARIHAFDPNLSQVIRGRRSQDLGAGN
ncbi:MAG: DUF4105 domain-containing protein [Pirellula sp.]|jgi:hypothetical protein